jgi:hypothetical protein
MRVTRSLISAEFSEAPAAEACPSRPIYFVSGEVRRGERSGSSGPRIDCPRRPRQLLTRAEVCAAVVLGAARNQ